MRRKDFFSRDFLSILSVVVLVILFFLTLSCAAKTRTTGIINQSLPLEDQKAIYDLLVRTALNNMRNSFNWSILDCYVKFPEEISFGQEIISSYDFPVPIRPASECKMKGKGVFAHIYGMKTHKNGTLLTFDKIDHIEGNTVRCGFGWYHASLSSHSWSYRLEKIEGTWVIKETLLEIIS